MTEYLKTKKIGPKLWVLTDSFGSVPKGFYTDGASVPRLFHNILAPMTGYHAEEAVKHDFYYSLDSPDCLQKWADIKFLTGMLKAGTSKNRARLAYMIVRSFGKYSFKKCHSVDKIKFAYESYKEAVKCKTPYLED